MKKVLSIILIYLIIIPFVNSQEKIIEIYLKLNKNDQVSLESIKTRLGYPTDNKPSGKYSIELISRGQKVVEKNFDVSFIILTDPQ